MLIWDFVIRKYVDLIGKYVDWIHILEANKNQDVDWTSSMHTYILVVHLGYVSKALFVRTFKNHTSSMGLVSSFDVFT